MIRRVEEAGQRPAVARCVLEALTDWFGVEESREAYIRDSRDMEMFAAFEDGEPVGFACLRETGAATVELAVMGVLREYHRRGLGRQLVRAAIDHARQAGYRFMQVKTVKMGVYEDYDATNRFYRSMGFQEFEVFPRLWDEANPCQVYVMAL